MKASVRKRGSYWDVRAGSGANWTSLVVDDWDEAMRIAIRSEGEPWKLLNIAFLRRMGQSLDNTFRV